MKKLTALLLIFTLLATALPVLAEEATALGWQELADWADELKARGLSEELLNDPAQTATAEDGSWCLIYEFATLYVDRPEMTEDTVITGFTVYDGESTDCLRNVKPDYLSSEALAAYENDNGDLVGSSTGAVLYLTDEGWAEVTRDGQRIQAIAYTALHTEEDGSVLCGTITYSVTDNLITDLQVTGLNTAVPQAEVDEEKQRLEELRLCADYSQVTTSLEGTDLEEFNRDDLIFSGVDFLSATPEGLQVLLGTALEDNVIEDEAGVLRFMEFEKCTATFTYGTDASSPVLSFFSIEDDGMEGPRAIRIGDTLSSVLNRFRNGEGEYDEDSGLEVLYGDLQAGAPLATAEYGSDGSATLHYSMVEGDKVIAMYLDFQQMYLSNITLYIED